VAEAATTKGMIFNEMEINLVADSATGQGKISEGTTTVEMILEIVDIVR